MLLDQIASQPSAEQTPLLWTIIGWVVSFITAVVAAIIPSIIGYKRDKGLKQEISDIRKAQVNSIDKVQFLERRMKLISDLEKYIKAIEAGVKRNTTISGLGRTLTTIYNFAIKLNFSDSDKKAIQEVIDITKGSAGIGNTQNEEITSAMIQGIIEILNKGDYLVW